MNYCGRTLIVKNFFEPVTAAHMPGTVEEEAGYADCPAIHKLLPTNE